MYFLLNNTVVNYDRYINTLVIVYEAGVSYECFSMLNQNVNSAQS